MADNETSNVKSAAEYEKEIWLLKLDLQNWRTCYNITVIIELLKRIDQLKEENERLYQEISQLTRHDN